MLNTCNFIYRLLRFLKEMVVRFCSKNYTYFLLIINKVSIGKYFHSYGIPTLFIHHTDKVVIGNNFKA